MQSKCLIKLKIKIKSLFKQPYRQGVKERNLINYQWDEQAIGQLSASWTRHYTQAATLHFVTYIFSFLFLSFFFSFIIFNIFLISHIHVILSTCSPQSIISKQPHQATLLTYYFLFADFEQAKITLTTTLTTTSTPILAVGRHQCKHEQIL